MVLSFEIDKSVESIWISYLAVYCKVWSLESKRAVNT